MTINDPMPMISRCFHVDVHTDITPHLEYWPSVGTGGGARCHVYQTVEFIQTWQSAYGRATGAAPLFVSIREQNGTLLLLLPLAITRRWGVRVLSFIDADACDYNAPILFPTDRIWTAETAAALWADIVAALPPFDLVSFVKLPETVGGFTNPFHFFAQSESSEACHGTDLTGNWEAVERTLVGLRTLRKSTRALERIAPLRLEVAKTPKQRRHLLATLMAQKQRRFEETRVPGFDEHPEKFAFFDQASEVFAEGGSLHLCGLYVGNEIVATAWGLIHAGVYYGLMIGSEAGEWASYSPGRILYHMLMRVLHESGCTLLDCGIGNESWKVTNCDRTVPLRMHVEAVTWRGHAFLAGRQAIEGLRDLRLWQRARPYKWVVLRWLRVGIRTRPLRDLTPSFGAAMRIDLAQDGATQHNL